MMRRLSALPTLTLKTRLTLRLIGSAILMIILCATAAWQLLRADLRLQRVVGGTLAPVADVGQIQNDYNEMMQAVVHAALMQLPSAVADAATTVKSSRLDIQRHWKPLLHSGLGQQKRQLLKLATQHRREADQAIDRTMKLLADGQFDIARLTLASDVQSAFVPLKSDFSNLFDHALATGREQVAAQHANDRRGLVGLLALLGVSLGLASWVDMLIIRSLGLRLQQACAVADRITAGVLGKPVEIGPEDEIGQLLRTLCTMDGQLESVVGQVRERAATVRSSAVALAGGNEALSQRTQAQAVHLQGASASMSRMAGAVAESVEQADQADRAVAEARTQTQRGRDVVVEAIASMREIDRTSRSMSEMLDLMDQVAFQTHMLALNAAVEAARVGVHGRGFSVVALEVRGLAQRASQAAKDIRQLIAASDEAVSTGTQLVGRAGTVLEQVAVSVTQLSACVAAMAAAGRGHAHDIGQVNRAVVEMDAMTRENATLVEQAGASSSRMRESALALLREVDFFTLQDDVDTPSAERADPLYA